MFYIILILFVKKIGELTKPRICKISRVLKPLKKRIVPLILTIETITLIYNLEWSAEKFKPYVDHCLKVKITINISSLLFALEAEFLHIVPEDSKTKML